MGNERPCKELSLELALDEVEASARKPRKWGFKGAQTSSRSKSKPGIKEHNIILYIATNLDFPLLVLVQSMYFYLCIWLYDKVSNMFSWHYVCMYTAKMSKFFTKNGTA